MGTFVLNPQQQEAVDTIQGPLLIIAGAGTGKTRVIVQRIANMLTQGISPLQILAVTFTNKAANEMRERVAAACHLNNEKDLTLSTFHSFCIHLLRQYADKLGFSRKFNIATEGYQKGLLREIAVELKLDGEGIDPYTWLSEISRAKADMLSPDDLLTQPIREPERISAIYRRYQERLKLMELMDFDDLLTMTVKLWEENPALLEAYRSRYRYLMIDEYQDTNSVQLKIMRMLAGETRNICAVGDDDQSIYGWRGADQRNILQYEEFFPGAKVIRLEQNYRSTNTILKAANALIHHNNFRREKELWSANGEGEKIECVTCEDGQAEAEYVASMIGNLSMVGTSLNMRNRDWKKFAILYRTAGQSRLFEAALRQRHIPYTIVGSKSFYQRKEILDVITMLELAVNPVNDLALQRVVNVPPRGIGDATLEKLRKIRDITHQPMLALMENDSFLNSLLPEVAQNIRWFVQRIRSCGDGASTPGLVLPRVEELLQKIEYMDKLMTMYKPRADALERKDNVIEFLTSIHEYDMEMKGQGSLVDFLEKIALQDANDRRDKDKDVTENSVSLMTIHASKGLEYPVVFVVGLEQGLFPHQMALDEGSLEEERRLCYVAMTRAKQRLVMSYALKRTFINKVTHKKISMFLNEVPDEYCHICKSDDKPVETSQEESLDFLRQIRERLMQK